MRRSSSQRCSSSPRWRSRAPTRAAPGTRSELADLACVRRRGFRAHRGREPKYEQQAAKLAKTLEAEEWLRRDGEIGLTAGDQYRRTARLLPKMIQAQINPWTAETVSAAATEVERLLEEMPKPPGFEDRQPIGDPWLESWKDGDPLRELSIAWLRELPRQSDSERVRALAAELLAQFEET